MSAPLPLGEALARLVDGVAPMAAEVISVRGSHRRIVAQDVVARRSQPPGAMSAMDGWAVRAQDVQTGARLAVVGTIAAGSDPAGLRLGAGQTARIFTGALLCEGADAVLIQENAEQDGDAAIACLADCALGDNVRTEASDFAAGMVLVEAGKRLTPERVMACAAGDVPWLRVRPKPRVALLATGDELTLPGEPRLVGGIVSCLADGMLATIEALGGEGHDLGCAPDSLDALCASLAGMASADVLLTLGGVSVGDYDLVRPALERLGCEIVFHRVALRPGMPVMASRPRASSPLPVRHVVSLPGNPVSAMVCARVFLPPLLARLTGAQDEDTAYATARLAVALPANGPRHAMARATLKDGVVTPFADQDSSRVRLLAQADALLVREPNDPARKAGEEARVLLLR